MKLSEMKRDMAAVEDGTWIGEKYKTPIPQMGDLCFKTRGQGNADWRALESKLIAAIPMQRKISGLSPADRDAVTGKCLLETAVIDWSGIEDEDGKPVAYSKAQAELFFTNREYSDIRDAALFAASLVGTSTAAALEADAKN